jgi:NAD(P)-dependent dehydrogenase (short-subunit alcohol dehydrogenase family)
MKSLKKLGDLSSRRAIVTGGAGHIGLAVGEALVELGADVSVMDLSIDACQERVEHLAQLREHKGVAIPCDLRDEQATREAVRQGVSQMGGLDILVHTAAYVGTTQAPGWAVPFEEQGVEAWDAAMRVNLTSAFVMAQEAQSALRDCGHGAVIFFASHYGLVGPDMRLYEGTSMANPAGYGASKGGLLQLTRYLATIFAPDIRVNSISPGGVWRDQPEEFHQRYTANTPLARMASEEDLKGAVAYLASDLSSYVTGHNLVVDGGITAW